MMNFFKNIFNKDNNKKNSGGKNDDIIRLYLDSFKKTYLMVKIVQTQTCQEIQNQYQNEILTEIVKNNLNSKLNTNEYAFTIIDDENIFTEIKLKPKDVPLNYLRKKTVNFYYLNILDNKKRDDATSSFLSDKLSPSIQPKTGSFSNDNIISLNTQEECLREGELLKYSHKHKRWDRRIVKLDKNKLIIIKPKNKGEVEQSLIILLSDISGVSREVSDKSLKEKFLFEIMTYEGEHYILKSKCNADLESWIESIGTYVSLVRDNKYLIMYGDNITKATKEIYEKSTRIVANCLSLKGVVSIKETRKLLFR
jgi:hypothetical protein